jgi:hypothetical protein
VQDGPIVGTQAAFRVNALVVGKAGLAERLGYIRNRVRGPWLISAMLKPIERKASVVSIADVAEWDETNRVLRLSPTTLTPLAEHVTSRLENRPGIGRAHV